MNESARTKSQARLDALVEHLGEAFADQGCEVIHHLGEATLVVPRGQLLDVATRLRDEEVFQFDTLIDVCGIDYSTYGHSEWATTSASASGYGRGVEPDRIGQQQARFAAVYQLLSVALNQRLRLRVFVDTEQPVVASVVEIWNGADWFEREAFDLYGILFDGHPDLRRILTDYGFIGHPFRKDFPLEGQVEMRYDPEQARVIYEPVRLEPRILTPRVVREDNRFLKEQGEQQDSSDA
jgi:NADH-quinone oxidoreductase subunit C